jgi:protein-disulfide isomerase
MIHQLSPRLAFGFGVLVTFGLASVIGLLFLAFVFLGNTSVLDRLQDLTDRDLPKPTDETNRVPTEPTDVVDPTTLRHVRGSGDLTFIEYSDLECPFCKSFHPTVNGLVEQYEGRVGFAYKHFPLNIHSKAKREAVAAECAGEQGKFFEYIDEIFSVTPSNNQLEDSELFRVAEELALDMDTFTTCVENEETLGLVAADALEAQATGGTGTPHSVLINADGKILTRFKGAISAEQLSAAFDQFLAEAE